MGTELFNKTNVESKIKELEDSFKILAEKFDEATTLLTENLTSPDNALYGRAADKILKTWEENAASLKDFINIFENWSAMVVTIGTNYATFEGDTATVNGLDEINETAWNNRTTAFMTTAGAAAMASSSEKNIQSMVDNNGISYNQTKTLEDGKYVTKKDYGDYYTISKYNPETGKYETTYYKKVNDDEYEKLDITEEEFNTLIFASVFASQTVTTNNVDSTWRKNYFSLSEEERKNISLDEYKEGLEEPGVYRDSDGNIVIVKKNENDDIITEVYNKDGKIEVSLTENKPEIIDNEDSAQAESEAISGESSDDLVEGIENDKKTENDSEKSLSDSIELAADKTTETGESKNLTDEANQLFNEAKHLNQTGTENSSDGNVEILNESNEQNQTGTETDALSLSEATSNYQISSEGRSANQMYDDAVDLGNALDTEIGYLNEYENSLKVGKSALEKNRNNLSDEDYTSLMNEYDERINNVREQKNARVDLRNQISTATVDKIGMKDGTLKDARDFGNNDILAATEEVTKINNSAKNLESLNSISNENIYNNSGELVSSKNACSLSAIKASADYGNYGESIKNVAYKEDSISDLTLRAAFASSTDAQELTSKPGVYLFNVSDFLNSGSSEVNSQYGSQYVISELDNISSGANGYEAVYDSNTGLYYTYDEYLKLSK